MSYYQYYIFRAENGGDQLLCLPVETLLAASERTEKINRRFAVCVFGELTVQMLEKKATRLGQMVVHPLNPEWRDQFSVCKTAFVKEGQLWEG